MVVANELAAWTHFLEYVQRQILFVHFYSFADLLDHPDNLVTHDKAGKRSDQTAVDTTNMVDQVTTCHECVVDAHDSFRGRLFIHRF